MKTVCYLSIFLQITSISAVDYMNQNAWSIKGNSSGVSSMAPKRTMAPNELIKVISIKTSALTLLPKSNQ